MSPALAQSLPLLAGAAYAASALWSKRACIEGGGVWRITFLTNWGQALFLLPLIGSGEGFPDGQALLHVGITSLLFFLGQVVVFAGLRFGDVSVLTPVMGIKVLAVAALSVALSGNPLPTRWWWAAGLASASAALLGLGGRGSGEKRRLLAGVLGGGGAALAFAGVDLCFQFWGGTLGVWRFTSLVMLATALWSLLLLPWLEGPWFRLPSPARQAFLPSLAMNLVQVVLMAYCVVVLQGAAWANLLYSSRGLWSVLLVWSLGPAFGNQEREAGAAQMLRRLAGSALLLAAIALVLL
jgi:hypothetical protein